MLPRITPGHTGPNIRFDRAPRRRSPDGRGLLLRQLFTPLFARGEPHHPPAAVAHFDDNAVDETTAGILLFPDGLVASFTCGMGAHADNTASLCGTEELRDRDPHDLEAAGPQRPLFHRAHLPPRPAHSGRPSATVNARRRPLRQQKPTTSRPPCSRAVPRASVPPTL